MTFTRLAAATIGAALLSFIAARAETPAQGDAALAKLAWLVGDKWVAEIKGPDGTTPQVELTVDWAGHRKALKYVIIFKTRDRSVAQYEGTYWWHPAKKQLMLLQIDRAGNMTEAAVAFDGPRIKTENLQIRADGTTHRQRTELTRDGDDAFAFKAFVPKDGAWVEAASFNYKRVRDAK